jgi:gamma-aminobutyrate permease
MTSLSNPAPADQISTPGLGKALEARHVAMISIGGIIGAGLFVGSSAAIHSIGPAVIVSYGLAGLMILLVMRMLSEMAMAAPEVGSFTEYARLGLGRWAGFTSGWLYWYFWVVVVAIEAIAGAKLIQDWLPGLPIWLIGSVLLGTMTAINLMSTRSYGEFEFWFASIKVAAIIAFIVVGASFLLGFPAGHTGGLSLLTAHGGFAPFGPVSVLAGVTSVIFALCGAEIATIAAAESAEPARTIAKMTGSVVLRIMLFYIASMTLIVAIVPWDTIQPGQSPFAMVLETIGFPAAATVINIIVLTAVLSCLNSGLYVTSRVLFTLADKGDAPQALVKVTQRQVPARAILIASSFGYLALAASVLSPERVFAFLVNASGAIMLIVYLMIAAAQIVLRRKLEREAPERLTLKMWLFPYASYAAIAAMLAVLVAMALTPDLASQLYASLGCLALVLIIYAAQVGWARRVPV